MNHEPVESERPLSAAEILGWIEFGCWTMLALAPMLYYVNGPAVSTDQLVMRSALVTLAAVGAVALALARWRRASRCDGLQEKKTI